MGNSLKLSLILYSMYMGGVLKRTNVGTNGNSYTLEACDYLCGLLVFKVEGISLDEKYSLEMQDMQTIH